MATFLPHFMVMALMIFLVFKINPPSPRVNTLWTPCFLSVAGAVTKVLSYFLCLVLAGRLGLTLILYTCGALLDTLDGRLARLGDSKPDSSEQPHHWFWHAGSSKNGGLLDATLDKVSVMVIYGHLIWAGGLNGSIDFLLTFICLTDLVSGLWQLATKRPSPVGKKNDEEAPGTGCKKLLQLLDQIKPGQAKAWLQQFSLLGIVFASELGIMSHTWVHLPLFVILIITLWLAFQSAMNHMQVK